MDKKSGTTAQPQRIGRALRDAGLEVEISSLRCQHIRQDERELREQAFFQWSPLEVYAKGSTSPSLPFQRLFRVTIVFTPLE